MTVAVAQPSSTSTSSSSSSSSKRPSSASTKKMSKRQKQKSGPNPSNTWPQQPKIKSMAARDKAYVKMAGLGPTTGTNASSPSSKSSQKAKEPLNPKEDIINSPEYKFGRLLASPIARTRHATILKLKEYLKARTNPNNEQGGLTILDLMKLWKGLWHTLYLCDGVAVQEEVSKVLAGLMWSVGGSLEEDEYAGRFYLDLDENVLDDGDGNDIEEDEDGDTMQIIEMSDEEETEKGGGDNETETEQEDQNSKDEEEMVNPSDEEDTTKHCRGAHLSALYIRTYFRTLIREWSNMDKYRIDKFYTLTRFILREIYRYMASRHWNLGIIRLFNDAIFEEVLRVQNYGNGVRFHLLDICLDELALVNSEKENGLPLTEPTFLDCMEPYFAMSQRVEDKLVHDRVMEKVLSRFLDEYSIVSDNYSNPTDELKDGDDDKEASSKKKLVMDQVHVQTVAQFIFELASDSETQDRYRKQLYDMHKTYMKRIKLVGRDVIMFADEEDDTSKEEESVQSHDNEDSESVNKEENTLTNDSSKAVGKDADTEKTKKKKKKKKKKKDKKKASKSDSDELQNNANEENEEVITISSEEQKVAAKAVKEAKAAKGEKKKTPTKKRSSNVVNDGTPSSKKVKFGKVNKSKSWKASMKDLKKLNPKATLKPTPEKGILRDKIFS